MAELSWKPAVLTGFFGREKWGFCARSIASVGSYYGAFEGIRLGDRTPWHVTFEQPGQERLVIGAVCYSFKEAKIAAQRHENRKEGQNEQGNR